MMHSQFVHSWFDKIYLMSCLYYKWILEIMNEDRQKMASTTMKINKKS